MQWKDGEGEWLAKPKVTYFTVASDRGDGIAEPRNLHVSSTGGGAVSIAWDPVEGAKRYVIYTIRADEAYDSWRQSKALETEQTSVQLDGFDALRSAEAVGVTAVDGEGNESYIRATTLRSLTGEPQDEPYTMSTWREIEDRKAEEAARAKNLAQPALVRPPLTSWRTRIQTRGPVAC
ncbi:fibronectin type III domain-containing protein [Bifidobacterium pseudolongum]|uniref:fibronectin type III domain-containing protein n=1 Tax=Bifidobacterium pseudolongum TaxID=1694 RepID=UPI003519C0A9